MSKSCFKLDVKVYIIAIIGLSLVGKGSELSRPLRSSFRHEAGSALYESANAT
jgi:hypothetical protein